MSNIPTRQEAAKQLGRRVSKGEYERIFSGLQPKVLKTVKHVRYLDKDGNKQRHSYNPRIAVRHPDSPKAKRKQASRNG